MHCYKQFCFLMVPLGTEVMSLDPGFEHVMYSLQGCESAGFEHKMYSLRA